MLAQTKQAYRSTLEGVEHEILVTSLHSWGGGINELRTRAKGDYLLFAADDAVPHPGWYDAALDGVQRRCIPAARFLTPDGNPEAAQDVAEAGTQIHWTRFPFLGAWLADEIGPLLDLSWYVDFDYSRRLEAAGWPVCAWYGFTFTHHDAPRDWLTPAEMERQRAAYLAADPANA